MLLQLHIHYRILQNPPQIAFQTFYLPKILNYKNFKYKKNLHLPFRILSLHPHVLLDRPLLCQKLFD